MRCRMQDIPRLHRNFREEFIAKHQISIFHCHRIRCIRNVGKVMVTTLMGRTADCCFPCGVFQRLCLRELAILFTATELFPHRSHYPQKSADCGGNTTKSKRSLTGIKHDGTCQS